MLLKARIALTVLVGMLYAVFGWLFGITKSAWQAQFATGQLSDDPIVYGLSRTAATSPLVENVAGLVLIIALMILWAGPVIGFLRKSSKNGLSVLLLLVLAVPMLAGCGLGPAQKELLFEIKPNETAFFVPLEGASKSGQAKFMSVSYLEENKVPSKRVTIPQRKRTTGRWPGEYEWIPTQQIITVDRAPVVREWTNATDTGTSAQNQAILVETVESIDFYVGVNATVMIREEDAATFLYYFAGKPLSTVMDQNIRAYVQSYLYKEFGTRTLDKCRTDKKIIFEALLRDAREFFAPNGITIEVIGGSEGYTYKDPQIQSAINQIFTSAQQQTVALNEKLAQDERNKKDVEVAKTARTVKETAADADAYVTKTTGQAQNDIMEMQGKSLQLYPGLISMEIARRSTGQVPSTLYVTGDGQNLPFVVTLPGQTPIAK